MKANEFLPEANIGTHPKRPSREGSRPERGHEPQKRYVTDRKTGKQYDPDEEFDKLKNSPEFQAQMKRMAQKEGFDYTMKDLGNDYAGFPSNHSMKHKMLKRIKPEKHQLYKDKMNNMHEFDQLLKLFKVAQARGDVIEQGVAEGSLNEYGDTAKGQKMLTKVQKRAVDRVVSKKADTDPKYAKKNSDTANRAWDRMTDLDEVAMRMQGSSQSEKDANARAKALEAEEKAKHLAIVKAYVDIMAAGQPLPPKMQQSYNTMPDFRKEVDAALKNIPGQPGVVDLEQRKNYHLIPKMEAIEAELAEHGKASRELCKSAKPDSELGASMLSSCKSQGLRARDGEKSHKLGKDKKSRIKVGGHRIKGQKYGGPLPDWS